MFYVVSKEKIVSFIVAIVTVAVLFGIAFVNKNSGIVQTATTEHSAHNERLKENNII